nr:PREDICTED: solute carrier family 2, facilitated glucose transporter member 5 [Anolis carolinensis]|eukprot:XP_016854770.1 PREDICTED: solute carrier family 2, facilitated glucose transporter member 5 [Anolis carolinensis]
MKKNQDGQEPEGTKPGRMTLTLALVTFIAAFGSSFQYGYNVSVINSPYVLMQDFYNKTYMERYGEYMDSDLKTALWSITVSFFPLGGFFGSLLVGPMVNKFGRKGTLLINNIFSIIPAILMGSARVAKTFEIIIVCRIVIGICAGLSSNVVPMYLGELSPKNLRGASGVVPQLFITIGILVAQILGMQMILGNYDGWPILLGLTGVPAALQLLTLPFFPESPRYLLIQKGDEDGARKALKKLRGWDDVDDEMEEMWQEDQAEKAEGRMSVFTLFTYRGLRWQLISIIVMMMGQQLSGVNAIYYYADEIYLSTGLNKYDVQFVTAGTGAVNVVMTFLAVFIVESLGRRILLLVGFGICCVACAVLTVALNLTSIGWMSYVSIASIISYVIGHAIGASPIPSVMIIEMFLQSSRSAAFMIGGSVHWLSNFTVGLVFNYMRQRARRVFLPHLLRHLLGHRHLHLLRRPRNQEQDLHGDQPDHGQEERGRRRGGQQGGARGFRRQLGAAWKEGRSGEEQRPLRWLLALGSGPSGHLQIRFPMLSWV